MFGIRVNPATVREGDKLATKFQEKFDGTIEVFKTRVVKSAGFCAGKPECVHLDHECYDSRFGDVVIAQGKG